MAALNSPSKQTFRVADRLAAAQRGRFVGREAELELLRSALLTDALSLPCCTSTGQGV